MRADWRAPGCGAGADDVEVPGSIHGHVMAAIGSSSAEKRIPDDGRIDDQRTAGVVVPNGEVDLVLAQDAEGDLHRNPFPFDLLPRHRGILPQSARGEDEDEASAAVDQDGHVVAQPDPSDSGPGCDPIGSLDDPFDRCLVHHRDAVPQVGIGDRVERLRPSVGRRCGARAKLASGRPDELQLQRVIPSGDNHCVRPEREHVPAVGEPYRFALGEGLAPRVDR